MAPSPTKKNQNLNVKITAQLKKWFENCKECEAKIDFERVFRKYRKK